MSKIFECISNSRNLVESKYPEEGSFSSEKPLGFYDRLHWDWDNFKEIHPEYAVTIEGDEAPYSVRVMHNETGEVLDLEAVDYDGSVVIQYKVADNGLPIDSLEVEEYVIDQLGEALTESVPFQKLADFNAGDVAKEVQRALKDNPDQAIKIYSHVIETAVDIVTQIRLLKDITYKNMPSLMSNIKAFMGVLNFRKLPISEYSSITDITEILAGLEKRDAVKIESSKIDSAFVLKDDESDYVLVYDMYGDGGFVFDMYDDVKKLAYNIKDVA